MREWFRGILPMNLPCSGGRPACRKGRASRRPDGTLNISKAQLFSTVLLPSHTRSAGRDATALRQAGRPPLRFRGSTREVSLRGILSLNVQLSCRFKLHDFCGVTLAEVWVLKLVSQFHLQFAIRDAFVRDTAFAIRLRILR